MDKNLAIKTHLPFVNVGLQAHFPIPFPTHATMPSPKNANYTLDIMPEDRLFTDALPDDLLDRCLSNVTCSSSSYLSHIFEELWA
jgi:hypothetical protein